MPSASYSELFYFHVHMSQLSVPWWGTQTSSPQRMKGRGRNLAAIKLLQLEHFSVVMEGQEIRPLSQVSLTGFSWGVIVVQREYPFSLSLTFVSSYQFLFLFQMTHGRIYLERRGSGRKAKNPSKITFSTACPHLVFFNRFFSLLIIEAVENKELYSYWLLACVEQLLASMKWFQTHFRHLTIILHLLPRYISVTNVFSKMLRAG